MLSLCLECPSRSSSPRGPFHSPDLSSEVATSSERPVGIPSNPASSNICCPMATMISYATFTKSAVIFAVYLQVVLFVPYVPNYNVKSGRGDSILSFPKIVLAPTTVPCTSQVLERDKG